MIDDLCDQVPVFVRRTWRVSCVCILVSFGCMMLLFVGSMSDVFPCARSSSKN